MEQRSNYGGFVASAERSQGLTQILLQPLYGHPVTAPVSGGGMVKAAWFRNYAPNQRPTALERVVQEKNAAGDHAAAAQHADAMIVFSDNLTNQEAARVSALAANHHLPAIYLFRQFATGGLIVYGPDIADLFRRAGSYVDKILKGTKPADLPVEQPTKFELVINMTTAKALGLTVPPSLLVRADEVIE